MAFEFGQALTMQPQQQQQVDIEFDTAKNGDNNNNTAQRDV